MSTSRANEIHSLLGNQITPKSIVEQSSLFRKTNTHGHREESKQLDNMLQTSTSAIAPHEANELGVQERSHDDLQLSHDNQNDFLNILNRNEHQNTQQFLTQGGNRSTPRGQPIVENTDNTETTEETKQQVFDYETNDTVTPGFVAQSQGAVLTNNPKRTQLVIDTDTDPVTEPASARASFKQKKNKRNRVSLADKLATSKALKSLVDNPLIEKKAEGFGFEK